MAVYCGHPDTTEKGLMVQEYKGFHALFLSVVFIAVPVQA